MTAKDMICALVAQLDRVLDYESRGRGFESLRAHQKIRTGLSPCSYFYGWRDSNRPTRVARKKPAVGRLFRPWAKNVVFRAKAYRGIRPLHTAPPFFRLPAFSLKGTRQMNPDIRTKKQLTPEGRTVLLAGIIMAK